MITRLALLAPLALLFACESPELDLKSCAPDCDTGGQTTPTEDTGAPDTSTSPVDSSTDSAPTDSGEPADSADSAVEEEEEEDEDESDWDAEDDASWLFSDDTVHQINITLGSTAAASLGSEPYEYVEGDIEIDGVAVPSVGVRLKGKYGSYRTMAQKAAFKIDFNRYVEGQEFSGLKKLNLNNMAVDCSMLKEHMAYKIMRDVGLAAERTGYAWVTVDGHDFGLYNVLEQPNKEMLKRFYDHAKGNLYDGKYILYEDWSYTLLDFTRSVYGLYGLEEGEDVENADLLNVVLALGEHGGTDGFYEALGEYVDWDTLLLYWAAEQWVGQIDGYVTNRNNYYVYFDADDGKMEMIPWDLDYSFLEDSAWGMSWKSPSGVLARACQADDTCMEAWKDALRTVISRIDEDAYVADLEAWTALIEDYISEDPRMECTEASVAPAQRAMRTWVKNRSEGLTTYWNL